MGEYFFKIKNEELKKKVEEEKNFHNKITKTIFNIKKEFDIGDLSFGYSTKELILNFKEKKDVEKYGDQKFKNGKFRKNSTIAKRYLELVKDIEQVNPANIWFYYDLELYGKWSSFKFVLNGELYFHMNTEQDTFKQPEDFEEINGSEYHAAKEKYLEILRKEI